jgi:hypothetical protein
MRYTVEAELTATDENGRKLLIFRTDLKNRQILKGPDYVEDRDKDYEEPFRRSVLCE